MAIIVTTGNEVAGYRIAEYRGVVRGLVVRATSVVAGVTGGLKSIFGGNISEYEKAHAEELRADAVIAVRYDTAVKLAK
jgi:uncharacterized protein YbjQ (UPF0145 family)